MPKLEAVPDEPEAPLWKSDDLVEWLDKTPETRRFLIKDLLPADSNILMSGQQKLTFKTFTKMAIVVAITTGKSMSLIEPEEEGTALVVEEEGASDETKMRWLAVCKAMGVDYKTLKNKIGWSFRQGVKLNEKEWAENLLRETERLQPKIITFDAMFALQSGNENDTQDVRPITDLFSRLRNVCGSSILYLAHLNESHGWNPRADMDRQVRGSGLLPQAADLHLALRRYNAKDNTVNWLVRARGQAPSAYLSTWTFETRSVGKTKEGKDVRVLDEACISLANSEGKTEVSHPVFVPAPGVIYKQAELKKYLAGNSTAVATYIQQGLQDQTWKIVGEKAWRYVGEKHDDETTKDD